ncbi:MAG: bifunctional proline dehydrogenase/L-glutamate gamma-semialdehyde dehydrogenase PutA [Sphingomonadaceae bacterium]|nr:bifunctional proline dehydrogenase/L-glutamate gamma-semialdehyde dehydrogenase PutA [Sphingomonadaceae bacterium]
MALDDPNIRAAIRALHRAPEPDVLAKLLPAATLTADQRARVEARALGLLADIRSAQSEGWVNRFLNQYRLNTTEGTALLALAEAFLRVPDPETADLLIQDKVGSADWAAHAGKSDSFVVNASTWGLVMTRALVGGGEASVLKRLIARAGEPFVRQAVGAAMRMMGQVFVMGRTIDEALERADDPNNRGFTASFDMLGEAARTYEDARRYYESYEAAIDRVARAGNRGYSVSVKLSALHPRYETAHAAEAVPALIDMAAALAGRAAQGGIALTIDAEESERLEMSLEIIGAVARSPEAKGWDGLGMAIQAYSRRARAVIGWADELGRETARRLNVRLVKGAYWDSEIKRTQVDGLSDYPLFTRKAATDVSYLACARAMLASRNIAPAFASHNALTVATILEWVGPARDFEFQRLHGMGEGLYERLVREEGYACRTYAPVGGHRDLLAYLVRRLLENGANSSFVHQLADPDVSEAELLADPADKIRRVGGARHPSIPDPAKLFAPERVNSAGLDLADAALLADIARTVREHGPRWMRDADALLLEESDALFGARNELKDTHDRYASAAVSAACAALPLWSDTPVDARAAALERLADLLEEHRAELMALCVLEAHKTIPDALAEVREAVDFCRYYAAQARVRLQPVQLPGPTGERNELHYAPRGVVACVSPWNFPLAIFSGQVAAALVAGNAVVAKSAPQTPRIAARAVSLARRAGVPRDALVHAPGGAEVGAALVADARVAGIAFTGSTDTARRIARATLDDPKRPLVPLIAETGGINAMIVDSTALPEQVVADIITSAFRSAGQRCSALRLLLVQEDVAQRTLHMLKGAMDTLVVGDPAEPATDVGPVIDEAAHTRLMAYRASVRSRWVHTVPAPETGHFVPPTVIALDRIEDLAAEWFGPLLHVARWKAGELEATIERVNALGFGLTMGLHSRIARAAELAQARAHVGNLYINRSMIGAVVGSQPFGGEGLSGTGPKAGGPNYLMRFAVERTVSIDTTSAGGNASLLSIDDAGL